MSLLAAQEEADAGEALLNMPCTIKSTIRHDSTSRSSIDGDWVSIVLRFSDDDEFDLRPIYMAVEDRENIINLLEETFTRMAVAVSIKLETYVPVKTLWENITYLSTDSVSKNFKIGEGLAEHFHSSHVPIHLLCKSHTVEGLDRATLKVLSTSLEEPLKLRLELEGINPSLRIFFRNSTVVQARMTAFLKIVTPDTAPNSCSLSIPFEKLCIEQGWSKKIVLYKERRFCKLGSCANSIIQALPILEQLLEETPADNLLAQACLIYIKCEIFITELRLLSFFNYHVVFPFLHMVEKSNVPNLKKLLPELHIDLRENKINTLSDFKVESKIGNIAELGNLEILILQKLTIAAADCIQLQCGKKYGFPALPDTELRASDLSKIPDDDLLDAPDNNLICERRLSIFSNRSVTAKFKTRVHIGELLRDNMVLCKSERKPLCSKASSIQKQLTDMNLSWCSGQKQLQILKIQEKNCRKK